MPIASRSRRLSLAAAIALALGGGVAAASDVPPEIAVIWKDPTFQKQFVGAYGINADIEPRVMPDEVKLLEKVAPLMGDDLAKAEATLTKGMKPDCSAILDFTLGGIRFQQERYEEALANYRTAVKKYPSFKRAWRNIGLIEARNSNLDKAIEAFTQMLKLGSGDSSSYGLLAFAYASKEDYQAAEVAYRNALLLEPEQTEWRLGLTRAVFRQKKFEDAASLLDVLIERFPDKADFWLLQSQCYLEMKQPLRAAENLEALDLLGKATPDSLYTLGDIYLTESLPELAARAYGRGMDADPSQSPKRALQSAELLAARSAFPAAREVSKHLHQTFDTALAQAGAEEQKRKLLKLDARLSMADGGGSPETAALLEEVVRLDPLDGDALLLLGQHYARQNEPEKAIFTYERAASIEAFEANARIRHAQLLVGMGRYADALPLLRRAQEVKPRDDVARYLDQVERIAKAKR